MEIQSASSGSRWGQRGALGVGRKHFAPRIPWRASRAAFLSDGDVSNTLVACYLSILYYTCDGHSHPSAGRRRILCIIVQLGFALTGRRLASARLKNHVSLLVALPNCEFREWHRFSKQAAPRRTALEARGMGTCGLLTGFYRTAVGAASCVPHSRAHIVLLLVLLNLGNPPNNTCAGSARPGGRRARRRGRRPTERGARRRARRAVRPRMGG